MTIRFDSRMPLVDVSWLLRRRGLLLRWNMKIRSLEIVHIPAEQSVSNDGG